PFGLRGRLRFRAIPTLAKDNCGGQGPPYAGTTPRGRRDWFSIVGVDGRNVRRVHRRQETPEGEVDVRLGGRAILRRDLKEGGEALVAEADEDAALSDLGVFVDAHADAAGRAAAEVVAVPGAVAHFPLPRAGAVEEGEHLLDRSA